MATNFEHYYSTPDKLAKYIGCPIDCYECVYPPTIPCFKEFGTTNEMLLKWLNSEYDEEAETHKGKFSL